MNNKQKIAIAALITLGCSTIIAISIVRQTRRRTYNVNEKNIMEITHPLNMNRKFDSIFTFIPNAFIGVGIKRTNKYNSMLSKEEWLEKRQEFWETRVEGSKEIWATIKAAVEADEKTAKRLLKEANLILEQDSMQIMYDSQGMKYDIPVFCINEPVSFPKKKSSDQGLVKKFTTKPIHFKARCTKWDDEMVFDYQTDTSVQVLRQAISSAHQANNVRIFFNGREMQNNHQIGNYGIIDDSVLQILQND